MFRVGAFMNPPDWLNRRVSRFARSKSTGSAGSPENVSNTASSHDKRAQAAPEKIAIDDAKVNGRSTRDRLSATLRQKEEALSPRVLRRTLLELKKVVEPQVSEIEGGLRAKRIAQWYAQAAPNERRDMWLLMSEQFVADPEKTKAAHDQFAAAIGTPDEAVAEVRYRRATVSPRRRLLQRFSAFPEGIRFLVDLRAEMLPHLKTDRRLAALDVEMEYMFSTWFDVGFLDLRRISWDSPASLIEKLIKYEAVHDIKSWADVKNRLDSDRRCYGFFHPRLPDDPLIFVEVALTHQVADCITPLLDESADVEDLSLATTAVFYSISNTQAGLRGVSFGDSLIKRVVDTLKDEFPKLKTFVTLSPIPGFKTWLARNAPDLASTLQGVDVLALPDKSAVKRQVLQQAAYYLGRAVYEGKPVDAVARFHLGNGARVERLNWAGDPSAKGLKQSYGVMVNYLYDLKRLDKHRLQLAQGKIPVTRAIADLYS
jgi:malonyl-CoA decarboxylase